MIVGDDRVHRDLPVEVLAAVHQAVAPALAARLVIPPFGSWAWCELAEDDPARSHATVRAALAWWSGMAFGPGVPASVLDHVVAERMADASREVSAAANWRAIAHRPTYAELERRRAVPSSSAHRGAA